jgi:DNA-binding NtrC family response regulator
MTTNKSVIDQKYILCIEPNKEMCLLLGMMLPAKGLKVTYVARIEQAAKFLQVEHPALIIIENIFALNEIARHIATIKEDAPRSKILMVSSIGDEAAAAAKSAGVDLFLTKPFNKSTLLQAVLSMLD